METTIKTGNRSLVQPSSKASNTTRGGGVYFWVVSDFRLVSTCFKRVINVCPCFRHVVQLTFELPLLSLVSIL
jgi:hypothetical protein